MKADAVVIGAGIHGCSVALHLARSGIEPVVFEQSYPGRHASGVNAGGVRRLGRHFSEVPLSVAAMKLWWNIRELVDDDCGFESSGQVKVAESETEFELLENRVKSLSLKGYEHEEIITQSELKQRIPAISDHCCGAILCRGDGHAKPFRTVRAFHAASKRAGARFFHGQAVEGIKRTGQTWKVTTRDFTCEAPLLINCAGAWGNQIAALLGEPVPLRPTALMLMISERLPRFCTPVVGATNRTLSFKQFGNGTVLIGGGLQGHADMARQHGHVDIAELAVNARTARDIFPLMEKARIVRCWAGIEGVTPDQIPVIGPSSTYPDAYHVFGFSAHGFQLGPITGSIISDLVNHQSTDLPIGDFAIQRFVNA
jgi:sarcosine oxidase subunit beta